MPTLSGATTSAAISTPVASSVRITVRRMPTRSARRPHTSLPAAPPTNTRARPKPTLATLAPLAMNRNGKKVRKPVRQALSMSWMVLSSAKPVGSVKPHPGAGAFAPADVTLGRPTPLAPASSTSVRMPTPATTAP